MLLYLALLGLASAAARPDGVTAREYFWHVSGIYYEKTGGEAVDYISTTVYDGDWFSCGATSCYIIMNPIIVSARAHGSSYMEGFGAKYTHWTFCGWGGTYQTVFTYNNGFVQHTFYPNQVCQAHVSQWPDGPDIIGAVCADASWCSASLTGYLEKGPYEWFKATPVPGWYDSWDVNW